MASGSFKVGTSNSNVEGELQWSSTTNVSGNYSTVSFSLYFYRKNSSSSTWGTGSWQVWINGTLRDSGSKSFTYPSSQAWVLVHSGSVDVPHNADGSKQVEIAVDGWTDVHDVYWTASYPWLDTIPRASSITSGIDWIAGVNNLSVSIGRASSNFTHTIEVYVKRPSDNTYQFCARRSNVATSCTFEYTNVDEVKNMYINIGGHEYRDTRIVCHTYNGGTLIGSSDKYGTIRGQTPATISFNDFEIGTKSIPATLSNFNSNFRYTLTLTFEGYSKPEVLTLSSANPTIALTDADVSAMFAQVTDKSSGIGNVFVSTKWHGTNDSTGIEINDGIPVNQNKSFTATVPNTSAPTFSSAYTYKDTNTTITAITGNNQYIVQNKSALLVEIPSTAKAIAKDGATMVKYEATVNGVTISQNYSSTSTVSFNFGAISSDSNTTLTVRAIDSRGMSTYTTKTILVLPYSNPISNSSAVREGGFGSTVTLTISGSISPLRISTTNKNDIHKNASSVYDGVQYRYKASDTATWNNWITVTPTISYVSPVVNFSVSAINLTNIDILKSWDIQISITDKVGSQTIVNMIVPVGQPIMFVDSEKKSVGINKFADNQGSLEVNGKIFHNNEEFMDSKSIQTQVQSGWYRIAVSKLNIGNCLGTFEILGTASNVNSFTKLTASISNGASANVTQIAHSEFANTAITKARVVYHTTYTGNYAYLEVYKSSSTNAINLFVKKIGGSGWSLIDIVSGSIPSGYTSKETILSGDGMATNGVSLQSNGDYVKIFHDGSNDYPLKLSDETGLIRNIPILSEDGTYISVDNTDVNNLTRTGWFMGSNCANAPSANWHFFEVMRHNDLFIIQKAYDFFKNKVLYRRKHNGAWQPWTTVADYDSFSETLWNGWAHMTAGQTAVPTKPLTDCPNGWILVWTDIDGEWDRNYTVVPKDHAYLSGSQGVWSNVFWGWAASEGKYCYINNTSITGHDSNDYGNKANVVLRKVLSW